MPAAEETAQTALPYRQTTIGTVVNLKQVAKSSIERKNVVAEGRKRNQRIKNNDPSNPSSGSSNDRDAISNLESSSFTRESDDSKVR